MTFNEWFCSLPEGRQEALKINKWMLAEASFHAGKDELWREFYRSDDFSRSDKVCLACGDTGKLQMTNEKELFCICPNGRGLASGA